MPRPRIAFIGAGSINFTRAFVRDLLTFPLLAGSMIVLMDIDEERLDFIRRAVKRIIGEGNYSARMEATMDRQIALRGADVVVCTILVGDVHVWNHDLFIPNRYGVSTYVGDTRGPSGVFRALRTIPVLLDICRDVERLCPDALFLNYTNPMAMNCRAMQRETSVRVVGLCHSVQNTARKLAGWAGAPYDEITHVCAGLNHLSWFLRIEHKGKDLYPRIRRAILTDRRIRRNEPVRNEMFLQLGYYVTESSAHNSEYNWWFRKRRDLLERYCAFGEGLGDGYESYTVNIYLDRERTWRKEVEAELRDRRPLDLSRGDEYASAIINAWMGGESFRFNGNVANTGLIDNLPRDACVEVPVVARRGDFTPMQVGPLPPQCAPLNQVTVAEEELAVEGCLRGDPEAVFRGIAYDPLSAAVLSLAEIRKMVKEMFRKNRRYLPQFRNLEAWLRG
ncbi:MAG: alpha-galactosidase [Planctomycetota bacterium]